jgi:hypothetical protein
MEKNVKKFERIDYIVDDHCILLSPGMHKDDDSKKPYNEICMQYATGKELKQIAECKKLDAIENPKENGVFCPLKSCDACEVLKDYNKRLNQPTSFPPIHVSSSSFVISIKSKEKGEFGNHFTG